MINKKVLLLTIFFFHFTFLLLAQNSKIEIPTFNDKYSQYVKQLENGELDIDYTDFRNSFVESKQFSKKGNNYNSLKKQYLLK